MRLFSASEDYQDECPPCDKCAKWEELVMHLYSQLDMPPKFLKIIEAYLEVLT